MIRIRGKCLKFVYDRSLPIYLRLFPRGRLKWLIGVVNYWNFIILHSRLSFTVIDLIVCIFSVILILLILVSELLRLFYLNPFEVSYCENIRSIIYSNKRHRIVKIDSLIRKKWHTHTSQKILQFRYWLL